MLSRTLVPPLAVTLLGLLATPLRSSYAQEHMMMQPGAEKMNVSLLSPKDGSKITANTVPLRVATRGFRNSCALSGKPNQEGRGHYHVLLDKMLVDMYCTETAQIALQNVNPGRHTLTVVPAQNDHSEIEANATSIQIDYAPAHAMPAETGRSAAAAPTIRIVSPKAGVAVSGPFDVVVEVTNFTLSCPLFGKPDLPGYGHWHLNWDSTTGPMMGMMTMAGMSCRRTFRASTAGFKTGSTHTLIALLAGNSHEHLMPEVADRVQVRVR